MLCKELASISRRTVPCCFNKRKVFSSTFSKPVAMPFVTTGQTKSNDLSQTFSNLSLPSGFRITYCFTEEECNYLCGKLSLNHTLPVVVGLDAEWLPFSNETIDVLQLCFSHNECYVFHLSQMGLLPNSLKTIIFNRWIVKVGLGIKKDLVRLRNAYCASMKLNPQSYIDLARYAEDVGFYRFGEKGYDNWSLKTLAEKVLECTIDKDSSTKLSNWKIFPLSEKQLFYAATDAYVSWLLFKSLDMERRRQEGPISAYPYLAQKLK